MTGELPPKESRIDNQAILVLAPDSAAGLRTDRFLANAIGTLSRTRVKGLMEADHLTRDGVVLRDPASAVRSGSSYRLQPPQVIDAAPCGQAIPLSVLFEDADILVLDKQPGLVVHPAPGNPDGTLVNALIARLGDTLPGIGGERRPGIVHRLDKDTSGVMVVAKSEAAMTVLSADIAGRRVERTYLALVWGTAPPQGTWSGRIGRDPRDRKRMAVVTSGGKHSLTRFQRLGAVNGLSLLRCRLETGRTHQIRVHAAAASHALVGDPVYGRRPRLDGLPKDLAELLADFHRQALHASALSLSHPVSGEMMRFTAPPPADMAALLRCADLEVVASHNER